MHASAPSTLTLGVSLLFSICCLVSVNAVSAVATDADIPGSYIMVDARIGETTRYTITPDDLPELTVYEGDVLEVCIGDNVGTCFEAQFRNTASRVLDSQSESIVVLEATVEYTPSSEADFGDTLMVPFEACTTFSKGLCYSALVTGNIVFTVTGARSTGDIAIKDAATVFEDFCQNLEPQGEGLQEESIERRLITSSDCAAYGQLTDAEKLAALAAINPEEVVAEYTITKQLIAAQTSNIHKRIRELRSVSNNGVSISGLTYVNDGEQLSGEWLHAIADSVGGSAGEGDASSQSKLGLFINGSITDGNRDGTNLERGYDSDANTITFGLDYRFSRNFIAGVAYGISQSTLEFDSAGTSNNDDMDNDMTNVIVYGTWYSNAFNVDFLIGSSRGDIETSREISLVSSTAEGDTESQQTFFSFSSGYEFNKGAFSFAPYVSYDYITGDIDGYQEANGGGFELAFDEQNIESKVITFGGRASYAISTTWGVVVPYVRGEWKKELDDSRDFITGRFVNISAANDFSIEAEDFDSSWFHGAVGLTANFRHGLSAYIDYESVLSYDDTQLNTVSYGGAWEASF